MSDDEVQIIACQPVNLDRMRSYGLPLEDMPPVTDLYRRGDVCESCHDEVWVGPRQNAMRQLGEKVHVLCYLCATIAQSFSGEWEVRDLGGGARVEGTEITPEPEEEIAYANMKPEDFPFTIEIYRQDTKEVLWRTVVEGPGAMQIPGFGGQGFVVDVRITYPDSRVETYEYQEGSV